MKLPKFLGKEQQRIFEAVSAQPPFDRVHEFKGDEKKSLHG